MIEKVRSYIKEHNLLSKGDRVVVGVSGGADSICLFHVLLDLSEEYDLTLFVVHVNHGIRGSAADNDQAFVEELCRKHKISYMCVKEDVPSIAANQGLSEEEVGRNIRYKAFNQSLLDNKCNKIAVAHNKNDNAETFLFNLFRGSGITGLSGIPPTRDAIIRPLLCIERSVIEEYLKVRDIPYLIDKTNLSNDYSRNKIRNVILKYTQEEINDQSIEHITRSASMLREINEFIDNCVNKVYYNIVKYNKKEKEIRINVNDLAKLDIVIQKELIRKVIANLSKKLKDIDSTHIQQVLDLMDKQVSKETHLPYDIVAIRGYREIIFASKKANDNKNEKASLAPIEIPVPGTMFLSSLDKRINTKIIKYEKTSVIPKEDYTKWFDYDKIKNILLLRTRQEGDYIQVNSKGGTKKINSLFIDDKVPRQTRNQIPLIADESHVIWVLGGRISEAYKITSSTKTILEISIY